MDEINVRNLVLKLESAAGVKDVLRVIRQLDEKGRLLLIKALGEDLSQVKRAQILSIIKGDISIADVEIRKWIATAIPTTYVSGATQAERLYKTATGKAGGVRITVQTLINDPVYSVHLEAVNTLLSNAYLDFANTMTGYVKGAERIINDAMKLQARNRIAQGRLEGAAIRDIKKEVKKTFADQGFTVLIDRGGREWTLDRYSEMLTRTQILNANNEGVVNRASDFGVDIVQVDSHGAQDSLCSDQEGKLYSITGTSDKYPPLGNNSPPFHPNCRHTLLLRPDLS